jgi:hypothetical protein
VDVARRKIRLIEGNATCRSLKKFTQGRGEGKRVEPEEGERGNSSQSWSKIPT